MKNEKWIPNGYFPSVNLGEFSVVLCVIQKRSGGKIDENEKRMKNENFVTREA
jgi:hypothetical protein